MFLFFLACHQNIGFTRDSSEPITSAWKSLLFQSSTHKGVDYVHIDDNRNILEDYLAWMGDNGPRMNRLKGIRWPRKGRENRRIAYYANAYNAWVLYEILENYPLESVGALTLDQFQLFENAYQVDGEYMTLHHLKEERILGTYQEPRIHMMLYDGSVSSPPLQYWQYEQFELILNKSLTGYLKSEYGAKKDDEGWLLSDLFRKREDDFIYWSDAENLCQYLAEYTRGEFSVWLAKQEKQNCDLRFQQWDYNLNELKKN